MVWALDLVATFQRFELMVWAIGTEDYLLT